MGDNLNDEPLPQPDDLPVAASDTPTCEDRPSTHDLPEPTPPDNTLPLPSYDPPSPTLSALLMPGAVLNGRYILSALLSDERSIIYKATDTEMHREVVIKLPDPGLLPPESPDFHQLVARFDAEAHLTASVEHPNVASVYHRGYLKTLEPYDAALRPLPLGLPFMVMALLRGAPLRSVAPIAPARAVKLFRACLEALALVHERNIAHKAITLDNLFIADPGWASERLCLLDFSSATSATAQDTANPADDVYQAALALIASVASTALPEPLTQSPLGPVLLKALHPDPDQRYPDARAFAAQTILEGALPALEALHNPEEKEVNSHTDDAEPVEEVNTDDAELVEEHPLDAPTPAPTTQAPPPSKPPPPAPPSRSSEASPKQIVHAEWDLRPQHHGWYDPRPIALIASATVAASLVFTLALTALFMLLPVHDTKHQEYTAPASARTKPAPHRPAGRPAVASSTESDAPRANSIATDAHTPDVTPPPTAHDAHTPDATSPPTAHDPEPALDAPPPDDTPEAPTASADPDAERLKKKKEFELWRKRQLATLQINANPISDVTINGRPKGRTPLRVHLRAGSYTVLLQNRPLKRAVLKKVTVDRGQALNVAHTFHAE